MWVELSLDGQYALTNAAGQTLRYFDLLQYDGTMPVEKDPPERRRGCILCVALRAADGDAYR